MVLHHQAYLSVPAAIGYWVVLLKSQRAIEREVDKNLWKKKLDCLLTLLIRILGSLGHNSIDDLDQSGAL